MRPASIASALSQPPSKDCKPNSPKLTLLPRVALPFTTPRWLLRNFTRLGISGIAVLLVQIIAVIDPYLDADVALGGLGLGEAVIDAGPRGRRRDGAVHAASGAGHFRAAQPAGELQTNALGPGLHRLVHRPLHRPPEAGPLLELLGDIFSDELRVHLRAIDLHRLDFNVPFRDVLELLRELVDLLTLLADDHADAGGVNEDDDLLARALNADLRDARAAAFLEAVLDIAADELVLDKQLGKILLAREPAALPVHHDAGAKARRSYFLSHG